MVLTVRHRAAFYKRFELDIWGVLKTSALMPQLPRPSRFRRWYKFKKVRNVKRTFLRLSNQRQGQHYLRSKRRHSSSSPRAKKTFRSRRSFFPWLQGKQKRKPTRRFLRKFPAIHSNTRTHFFGSYKRFRLMNRFKRFPSLSRTRSWGSWISWAHRKGFKPWQRRARFAYSLNPHLIAYGPKAKIKKKKSIYQLHNLSREQLKSFWVTFYYSKLLKIFDFFYTRYLKEQEYRWRSRRRYIYRLDVIQRRVFKKKIKKRFVSLRLVKLFYLTFHYHQFRQLAQRTRRLEGCFEHNFLLALEGRLVSFIYRTSLMPNLFQCIKLVRSGGILVDGCLQNHPNYSIGYNVLINFLPLTKKLIYLSLLYRLVHKLFLFNPPRYMFVSYVFLYCYMKRPPQRRDLVFPIALDMYRATGYAF